MKFYIFYNILALFLLNGIDLVLEAANANTQFWYLSLMLWTMLLFMHLLKNFEKKYVNLLIVLLLFFSYSFVIYMLNDRMYGPIFTYYGFINIWKLMAFGGIGLGYLMEEWYKNYSEKIEHATLLAKNKIIIPYQNSSAYSS